MMSLHNNYFYIIQNNDWNHLNAIKYGITHNPISRINKCDQHPEKNEYLYLFKYIKMSDYSQKGKFEEPDMIISTICRNIERRKRWIHKFNLTHIDKLSEFIINKNGGREFINRLGLDYLRLFILEDLPKLGLEIIEIKPEEVDKINNNSTNDDSTNDDSTNDDSTNDDSTNDDSTNDDSSNDDSTNDDSSNDDSTNDDSSNDDSNNDDSSNDDSTNDDSNNDDSSNDDSTKDDSSNDDSSNDNSSNDDSSNDDSTNDDSSNYDKIVLRDYQEVICKYIIDKFKNGIDRIFLELATGAGKTIIAKFIMNELKCEYKKIIIFSPRIDIKQQNKNKIKINGIEVSSYCIQSYMKAFNEINTNKDINYFIWFDEAHWALEEWCINKINEIKLFLLNNKNSNIKYRLFTSASPNKDVIIENKAIFGELYLPIKMKDLIGKYLVNIHCDIFDFEKSKNQMTNKTYVNFMINTFLNKNKNLGFSFHTCCNNAFKLYKIHLKIYEKYIYIKKYDNKLK